MRSSAGLLLYRRADNATDVVEVLIGHMGGPFWARKEDHSWSIPKGEYEPGESQQEAAVREFTEELGSPPPEGEFLDLGENRQRTGKMVHIWARAGDFDATTAVSNDFEMEWPPKSGRMQSFPEIDRAGWFDIDTARTKLVPAQEVFLDRLVDLVTECSA